MAYIATKVIIATVVGAVSVAIVFVVGGLGGVRMPGHVWVISALVAWIGAIVNVAFWTALFAAGAVWRFRRDTARV